MSTYKQQDIENLLTHLREGVAPDSVLTLVDDVQIECDGAKEGESVWMHLVLPGARYGKDDRVTYDPYETYLERSLSCSGGLPWLSSTSSAAMTARMRHATSRTWNRRPTS